MTPITKSEQQALCNLSLLNFCDFRTKNYVTVVSDAPIDFSGRLQNDGLNGQRGYGSKKPGPSLDGQDSDLSDCESDIDIVGDAKSLAYSYSGA